MVEKNYKLGIDVGNKLVKIFGDEMEKPLLYPSSLVRYLDVSYLFDNNIEYLENNDFEIFSLEEDMKESCYIWGRNLYKLGNSIIDTKGANKLRYENQLYRKLFLFSVAKYVDNLPNLDTKDKVVLSIAMGMPDEEYASIANNKFDSIKWMIGKHIVYVDNLPIEFEIKNVGVVPQEFGSIILYDKLNGGITPDVRTLVVDYGGVTRLRDIYDGFQQRIVSQDTLGLHVLIDKIVDKLKIEGIKNSRRNNQNTIEEMLISRNYKMKTGVNSVKDLTVIFRNEINNYVKERFEEDLASGETNDNLDLLILTGGGANILDKSIYSKLSNEVWIPENPETANVRGFYEYLKIKSLEDNNKQEEKDKILFNIGDKVKISEMAMEETNGYNLIPHRNWEGKIIKILNKKNEPDVYTVEYPTGEKNLYVSENDLIKI